MAKKTFNIWDMKEQGSLSANELISAFIKIGLSEDINFAKQIVSKIQPKANKSIISNDEDELVQEMKIRLKDFL